MSHSTYLIVHLAGLLLLALSIGGMVVQKSSSGSPDGKQMKVLHGVGLFLLLLGGFGMLARLSIGWPFPVWIFIKLAIWLAMGAFPVFLPKLKAGSAWIVAILLILTAIAMGVVKPF